MNFTRISIASLNKKIIDRYCHVITNELFRLTFECKYLQSYFTVQHSNNSKLYKLPKPKPKKKTPGDLFHINFCNKTVELIYPPAVFNTTIFEIVLIRSVDFAVETVIYELTNQYVFIFLISMNLIQN